MGEVGIGVDVLDPSEHLFGGFVESPMQDGDGERTLQEGGHDVGPGRTGTPDDERVHAADQPTSNRHEAPSRMMRPAVGAGKWVPMTTVPVSP